MSEKILDKNTMLGILGNLYEVEAGLKVVSEKLGEDDNCGMEAIVAALTDKLSAQIGDMDTFICRQLRSDS